MRSICRYSMVYPLEGLVMGTRCGDLGSCDHLPPTRDALGYLLKSNNMLTKESGLLN
ncbi:hypothetical protein O9992_03105 [Vibrio lentus]|nr:hypothetical protein [Vibrio lentus]